MTESKKENEDVFLGDNITLISAGPVRVLTEEESEELKKKAFTPISELSKGPFIPGNGFKGSIKFKWVK